MLKKLLVATTLLMSGPAALACNWVNPSNGVTRYLECQSNWRGFVTETAETKRMVEIAASFARGEAEKFAALEGVPRQILTVNTSDQIHSDQGEANALIDAINARIRRESAKVDNLDPFMDEAFRRLLPVGIFAGFSFSSKTLPIADQLLKLVNMTSGGSLTFTAVIMPKKVVMVQDVNTGQVLYLKDKTVTKSDEDITPVAFAQSSFNTPAAKEYTEGFLRRFDVNLKPMVLVAADLAPGLEAGKKNDAHFNLGLVFGDQIVDPHQLMGAGLSGSIPAKSAGAMAALPGIVPAPVKFLLRGFGAHRLGVDTIKWGTTVQTPQNPFADDIDTKDSIVNFKPATYLWFRWSLTKGKGIKGDAQQTVDTFNISEYRANGFLAFGAKNDGTTQSQLNGIQLVGDAEKQGLAGYALSSIFSGLKTVIYPEDEEQQNSPSDVIIEAEEEEEGPSVDQSLPAED